MAEARRRLVALGIALAMALGLFAAAWLRDAPRLPVSTLRVEGAHGAHAFTVELADTDAARDRGLQGRESLPPDRGLLIDYGEPRVGVVFWMKDTPLSLDLVFIAPDATILRIEERAAPRSEVPIPAGGIIRAVLEVRGGLTRRLGIAPGDRVRHAIFANAPP
jgi:uncharacterized membrane protein (UPF0127 family)